MNKLIIGIGHYSRTGKDTLANKLIEVGKAADIHVTKRSFAEKLKLITHIMYGWAGVKDGQWYEDHPEDRNIKLAALANERWPDGPTVVELWIAVGTPAIRENVYQDTWIKTTLNDPFGDILVIPDVRFPNEVKAIWERGGVLVKVTREGVEPRPGSVADNALINFQGWDYIVPNLENDLISLRNIARMLIINHYKGRYLA